MYWERNIFPERQRKRNYKFCRFRNNKVDGLTDYAWKEKSFPSIKGIVN